jgi:hypothetical protein
VEQLTIKPVKKISGVVKLPGSKSLSNRILLLAALAEGTTLVRNLLDSDDIRCAPRARPIPSRGFVKGFGAAAGSGGPRGWPRGCCGEGAEARES